MLKQIYKNKWYFLVILLLIIAEPSLDSVLNIWLQRIFNAAEPDAERLIVIKLLTTAFLLWVVKRCVIYTSALVKNRFICNAKQDVKHSLFCSIMKFDTSNISDLASSGEYISVFTNDITLLETRYFEQLISLIGAFFSIAILGTSFIVMSPKLAVAIIAFGVVSMFVPLLFSKQLNSQSAKYSGSISKFTQAIKEYIIAYPTIKNYSIEDGTIRRFDYINNSTEDDKFDTECTLSLANNVGQLLSWFMQFIGVGLGVILVIEGEIRIGTVVAAQAFASSLASPLQNIILNVNSIRSVHAIVNKIKKMSAPSEKQEMLTDGGTAALPDDINGYDVEFKNIGFAVGDKKIIKDFSFTFEEGKKYLIVGPNGSGKSTLFKLLKKWYGDMDGEVLLGGKNIRDIDSKHLSGIVSYMNENVSIFSGTVQSNITLFRNCSEDDFNASVNEAQVKLNLGKEITDEGTNISSGEQRRIEIARSLLVSVKIMIFDEVISTLDIETAYEIEKLALGYDDKTVIFISHNFSGKLVKQYDEILVMDGGALIAHGSYDYLMENCEYFKHICEIKFG